MSRPCRTTAPLGGRWLWVWLVLPICLGDVLPVWAGETDQWVLRGTVVLGGESGYAILEQPGSQEQQWRHTGAELAPGIRLVSVSPECAVIVHEGQRRQLNFGTRLGGAASMPVANIFHLDPLRIPKIAAAMDIIPHQQGGRVVGYYANRVPEALRGEVGLQSGDLLRQVNGIPLNDQVDVLQFHQLLNTGQLNLEVMRKGKPIQLVYRIGKGKVDKGNKF